ncbi:MAG: DUF4167 domain-containing protein [Alphaproteobacteria bacterium HGW-Alphaproteobacteria-2]|nr:MAG: DUF4167 domain-containing protein [Alphaproteobacteria bacterium HGW-Alphaproteobacteria-2]
MRPSKSRSRAKNNRRPTGNIINRVFDSSGPEGKVRGTPQQIIEKYLGLARDATLGNDQVAAENFYQHAEHYVRMLAEAQREIDARREQFDPQFRRERGGEDEPQGQREGGGAPQRRESDRDFERNGTFGEDEAEAPESRPERRDEHRSEARPERRYEPRPDVEVLEGGGDPGLVETPEAATRPRRSSGGTRRRSGGNTKPEAAESGEAPEPGLAGPPASAAE